MHYLAAQYAAPTSMPNVFRPLASSLPRFLWLPDILAQKATLSLALLLK